MDLFVGSLRCIFRYKNAEGEDKSHEVRENFNEILINALQTKNLYENWENLYTSFIEGYQTPEVRGYSMIMPLELRDIRYQRGLG